MSSANARKNQKSAARRGLGAPHRRQREILLGRHVDGAPCYWCAEPMFRDASRNPDGQPLEADHSLSRAHGGTKADRLLHSVCNRQRGDGSRDHLRPAVTGETLEAEGAEDDRSRWTLLDW
nr:hypothetical protein [Rhodococcus sp. p52]